MVKAGGGRRLTNVVVVVPVPGYRAVTPQRIRFPPDGGIPHALRASGLPKVWPIVRHRPVVVAAADDAGSRAFSFSGSVGSNRPRYRRMKW